MIKYFHELTDEEFKKVIDSKITVKELSEKYPQPPWCTYPNALNGLMGCWSLTHRKGISKEYCSGCDAFIGAGEKFCCK